MMPARFHGGPFAGRTLNVRPLPFLTLPDPLSPAQWITYKLTGSFGAVWHYEVAP
jgi:hypothetical protein